MRYFFLIVFLALYSLCLQAVSGERYRLLFTPERIRQAQKQIRQDSTAARYWAEIRQTADGLLQRQDLMKTDYLALAYLMTDDKKYAEKIREILLRAVEASSWGNSEMLARRPAWNSELNIAHKSFACAIAYDAVYPLLSPSDRKTIAQGLKRLALEPAFNDWLLEPGRIHSLNSMGHNWWASCVSMGGLLAMSLRYELPEADEWIRRVHEALPEWFAFAGDVLQHKPRSFDPKGGMYESLNYANFGIQEALLFRLAWNHTHPGENPGAIPQLENMFDFYIQTCYPRTGMLYHANFGDSHKNVTAESSLMLLYALGIRQDDMLWYFRQVETGQHRDGYFRNRPMGFLYTPDTRQAPQLPDRPTSALFPEMGWGIMRDSWQKDGTMLAVKSGFTWNHSHADANSFILFHKGTDIIKDAGNCGYSKKEYRDYFFQSRAHNVILFDGNGQPREQQYGGSPLRGNLYHQLDGGNIKYILADGTGPMSRYLSRNFRHFLWIDNVIYLIDDLKSHDMGTYQWLWHTGSATCRKSGTDLHVVNGNSAVTIRPLYPRELAKSDFIHDYPDDLYWEILEVPQEDLQKTETCYAFHLPGETNRVKGLTAIILKEDPAETDLPRMEKRQGADWIGVRICHKGKVTDIYLNQLADGRLMHSNSWITADGWETDAYLWAVSYREGQDPAQAEELFVGYGSALRRNGITHFSSLSKQYLIRKSGKDGIHLWIDGQSHAQIGLYAEKKPSHLFVNERETPVRYTGSTLKFQYKQ